MIIKVLISLFALFAVSRAYLRFHEGAIKIFAFFIWLIIWAGIVFVAWWPKVSQIIASSIGVGRGVDALIYISIVALLYAVFRIYVKLEYIERELTALVRNLALRDKALTKNGEQKK